MTEKKIEVRGHWRMVRCEPGRTGLKLVLVAPYWRKAA
jgi:hypothetical protein